MIGESTAKIYLHQREIAVCAAYCRAEALAIVRDDLIVENDDDSKNEPVSLIGGPKRGT